MSLFFSLCCYCSALRFSLLFTFGRPGPVSWTGLIFCLDRFRGRVPFFVWTDFLDVSIFFWTDFVDGSHFLSGPILSERGVADGSIFFSARYCGRVHIFSEPGVVDGANFSLGPALIFKKN